MKYVITIKNSNKIAEMDTPFKLAICLSHILGVVYGEEKIQIHFNTNFIEIPVCNNMCRYLKKESLELREVCQSDFEEIMYMHTAFPPESKVYREKIIAIMNLPINSVIFEIGGLLLNHLNYKSIDILKNKGSDGKYEQLIELDACSREDYHCTLHCGNWEAWYPAIKQ